MASWYSEKLLKPKVWTFHPIFDAFHHEDLDQTSKRNLFSVTHKKLTPQTDFRRSNTILIDFGKTNKQDWQRLYLSINHFWKYLNEIYQVDYLKILLIWDWNTVKQRAKHLTVGMWDHEIAKNSYRISQHFSWLNNDRSTEI